MMSPVVAYQTVQLYTNPIAQYSYQKTQAEGQTAADNKQEPPEGLHWTFALFFGNYCD